MNDENKVPVPDEAQASPAHAEDDIATLEREARAKREAKLLNAQDDEEKDPVQPAVNKLKKRKRGKATAFLAIVAVALIFLAWGGELGLSQYPVATYGRKETGHSPADEQNRLPAA